MLPYDFSLYLHSFPVGQYGPWMRLFTMVELTANVFIGLAAVAIKGKRQYQAVILKQAIAGFSLGLSLLVFNLLFGSKVASLRVCQGALAQACLEQAQDCMVGRK